MRKLLFQIHIHIYHPTHLGFEVSEARNSLISALSGSDFIWREFLLTPTQIGIPNSRLRYYLIAKKRDIIAASSDGLFESLPEGKIIGEFPGVEKNIESNTAAQHPAACSRRNRWSECPDFRAV